MRPIEILLVEDNPGDVRLTQEAMKDAKVTNTLHVVGDGIEALEFLRKEGRFQDSPVPDLVLLDLNLPRKSGREVLQEMKESEEFKAIPVVVLTTSEAHRDVLESYSLQANCYVTKPLDFEQFCKVVESIEQFWFTMVKLPSTSL
ncbi:MAG: response regulator [Vulcanimicrobiota bacterium]